MARQSEGDAPSIQQKFIVLMPSSWGNVADKYRVVNENQFLRWFTGIGEAPEYAEHDTFEAADTHASHATATGSLVP